MDFKLNKPVPSDRELDWDKSKIILSKTDAKGTILYANEAFIDISGYDEYELIGQPHNVIRHPDMPKVIFKMLWETIKKGENMHAIVKNMSKSGRYYWVITDFKTVFNDAGEVVSYFGTRKSIPTEVITKFINPLYSKLLHIEEVSGVPAAEEYLKGFLEERNKTYTEYVDHLVATGKDDKEKVKRGFFANFFKKKR